MPNASSILITKILITNALVGHNINIMKLKITILK